MNKRQMKKKEKKYLPIIADEFNLMTMTEEERNNALLEYKKFRERFAYCKRYKDLKEGKPLRYYFPKGEKATNFIKEISNVAHKVRKSKSIVINQTLDDFINR